MEEVEIKDVECELDCTEDSSKSRCDQSGERSNKAEARVIELEQEIAKRKREYEELEAKFRELEARHTSAEVELKAFKTGNNENRRHESSFGEKSKVDLTGEGAIVQLMAENRVLECEKREAESEVVVWKDKFKALELRVSQMDVGTTPVRGEKPLLNDIVKVENRPEVKSNVEQTGSVPRMSIEDFPASAGTPYKDSPYSHTPLSGREGICSNFEVKYHREVRKHLSFDDEKSPSKKIAPSTPGTSIPTVYNVINILDSEDESDVHVSTEHVLAETLDGKKDEICLQDFEDDVDECSNKIPSILTSKRKRVAKIVTSDTESDEDDNVPISKLIKTRNQEEISKVESSDVIGNVRFSACHSRRRLVNLRECEEKVMKKEHARPTSDDGGGESGEVGSESEGESLGGFIVNDSDASSAHDIPSHSENESDACSAQDVPSHSENELDGFDEILCKLERSKDRKCKWEFEADMLSSFGKDLELCMKAVCALYRQQTSDEQVSKEAKYGNGRGFSKFDAFRGTELAEFLTDGDPEGDLKKSKQQLEEYESSAVELCRTLATRYSKQLFEIYKNKEDPLFLPS